jgi:hypothetical protein
MVGETCIRTKYIDFLSDTAKKVNSMSTREAGHITCMEKKRNAYNTSYEIPDRRRPF